METPNPLKNIVIVGAGFSGLTLAALLAETKKFNIKIYEDKNAGGFVSADTSEGILFENAAPSLLNHHELERFWARYNLKTVPALHSAKKRYLYYSKLERWPLGLAASLKFAFRFLMLILKRNKLKTLGNLTVQEWSKHYLGSEFTDKVLRTAFFGIYAADISELNAELVLGRFLDTQNFKKSRNKSKLKGSVLPEGGLSNFLTLLKNDLLQKNIRVLKKKINTDDLVQLKKENIVIFATSFADFINLIEEKPEVFIRLENPTAITAWRELTAQIKNISLVKVHLLFNDIKNKINGFGVLFHPRSHFNSLGVIANSHLFSEYGPDYNESWILKFTSEGEILKNVLIDREHLFGTAKASDELKYSRINIHRNVYPLYNKTLRDWQQATQLHDGYFATGNYWGALGLTQIFLRNISLTESITAYAKK